MENTQTFPLSIVTLLFAALATWILWKFLQEVYIRNHGDVAEGTVVEVQQTNRRIPQLLIEFRDNLGRLHRAAHSAPLGWNDDPGTPIQLYYLPDHPQRTTLGNPAFTRYKISLVIAIFFYLVLLWVITASGYKLE